jgi:biopolymer transport protein ExbD
MPRVKVARKSTHIDMTAMCDVAFLLLTFFILTAKPRVDDPIKAEVPSSSTDVLVPEQNLAMLTIGGKNQVFYSVTGSDIREAALKVMGDKYHYTFTPEESHVFGNTEVFGVPMAQLKAFLNMDDDQKKAYQQPGIPVDTTNNNELSNWVLTSRQADKALHDKDLDMAIKGDKKEQYPTIDEVISVLGKQRIFKFRLITELKTVAKK